LKRQHQRMSGHRRFLKPTSQRKQSLSGIRKSPPVHRIGFELFADTIAPAIRNCRGCRQMGLAGCFARSQARSGQCALGFGFPLEPTARRLAASVRQFQPVRHPSRRPARKVSLLFSSRCSTRLRRIYTMKPKTKLELSVNVSVKIDANSRKFWRINPNGL